MNKIITLILIFLSSHCSALEKSIDIRIMSENDQYYIVFCARKGDSKGNKSFTGHAFVIFGIEDSEKKMSIQESFGFYPAEGTGVFGSVPGEIAAEELKSKIASKIIIRCNKSHYQKALDIKKIWQKKKYELLESDCISFVQNVAEEIGIKTPKRKKTDFPYSYIEKLIESN